MAMASGNLTVRPFPASAVSIVLAPGQPNTDISTLVEKIGVDFTSLNALLTQSTNGGDSIDSHHVSAYDGLSLVSSKIKEPLGDEPGVFK